MAKPLVLGEILFWYDEEGGSERRDYTTNMFIQDKVESECKKLYEYDIEGKMKTWMKLSPEEQEKKVNAEENMIFNLVFTFGNT